MGCDIHAYLEHVDENSDYVDGIAKFSLGRDYFIFSLMAGVRSKDGHGLFEPRGVPDNITWWASSEYYVWADENRSREKIESWVKSGYSKWIDKERGKATHPDWHSASWLTTAEMEQVKAAFEQREFPPDYEALLAAMKALGDGARIIFWFDN